MSEAKVRIIKKYPNRRLYDTVESRYVTLSDILDLIKRKEDFQVVDTQNGEDLTRSVLIQIITEQESGDDPLFTNKVLAQFIRMYDDTTRGVFTEFFEKNFQFFQEQQHLMQEQVDQLVGGNTVDTITKMARQNFEFWQDMQANFFDSSKSSKKNDDDDAS